MPKRDLAQRLHERRYKRYLDDWRWKEISELNKKGRFKESTSLSIAIQKSHPIDKFRQHALIQHIKARCH